MSAYLDSFKELLLKNVHRPSTRHSHKFTRPKLGSGYCKILEFLETHDGESHRSICKKLYKIDTGRYGNYNGDTFRDLEYAGFVATLPGVCKVSKRKVNVYHLTKFGQEYLNMIRQTAE
jgi:hypothetical protein